MEAANKSLLNSQTDIKLSIKGGQDKHYFGGSIIIIMDIVNDTNRFDLKARKEHLCLYVSSSLAEKAENNQYRNTNSQRGDELIIGTEKHNTRNCLPPDNIKIASGKYGGTDVSNEITIPPRSKVTLIWDMMFHELTGRKGTFSDIIYFHPGDHTLVASVEMEATNIIPPGNGGGATPYMAAGQATNDKTRGITIKKTASEKVHVEHENYMVAILSIPGAICAIIAWMMYEIINANRSADLILYPSHKPYITRTLRTGFLFVFLAFTVTPLLVSLATLSQKSPAALSVKIFDLMGAIIAGFFTQIVVMNFPGLDKVRQYL